MFDAFIPFLSKHGFAVVVIVLILIFLHSTFEATMRRWLENEKPQKILIFLVLIGVALFIIFKCNAEKQQKCDEKDKIERALILLNKPLRKVVIDTINTIGKKIDPTGFRKLSLLRYQKINDCDSLKKISSNIEYLLNDCENADKD